MEEAIEVVMEASIAEQLIRKKGKKNLKSEAKKKTMRERRKKNESEVAADEERLSGSVPAENCSSDIPASLFDFSVENHFRAVDKISELCGEAESDDLDKDEIERLSSSITFLREWKHFKYQPRTVSFACESETSEGKDVIGGINLPQFSAATVPKKERQSGNTTSPECSSKDFVLYVGGSVWALDWCPRVHQMSDYPVNTEFIAIAAHPPESCYHKIGAPLTGRGVVQVWCVLNVSTKEEVAPPGAGKKLKQKPRDIKTTNVKLDQPNKPRGRPRKKPINEPINNLDCSNQCVQALDFPSTEDSSTLRSALDGKASYCFHKDGKSIKVKPDQPKKPRGRPRKNPVKDVDNIECSDQNVQALAVQFPEDFSKSLLIDGVPMGTDQNVAKKGPGRKRKGSIQGGSVDNSTPTASVQKRRLRVKASEGSHTNNNALPALNQNQNQELPLENHRTYPGCGKDSVVSSEKASKIGSLETSTASYAIPKDVALPRCVLCLAHNGKVAWDVKWRPTSAKSKYRMGYLAVLLGSGALEVWEVPFPSTMKTIYSACQKDGTDPRFIKLEPVFRCSKLQCGNRQSIPLTMEWSASPPHDFILAGCHDGMVALWKFSANSSSKDTRPLLCFSADTLPIRALAWAPAESDNESANVIVTAGHRGGFKFWDIRDPFRPLWELNIVQRNIYSLDWLPDPRCIILSFDDGTLRVLSLTKAADDAPVTAKPFAGTQQQGLSHYMPLESAIWSVQVSRQTGLVAYCSADGNVLHFQLTTKEVDKGDTRTRLPHYLCGSLTEEEAALTVFTPLPGMPFQMKKSPSEWCNAPRTARGFLTASNKARRAKEQRAKDQTSDDQTLALCYGDDPETRFESEDTVSSQKSKNTPKSKMSFDQVLVSIDEETDKVERGESDKGKVGDQIESWPPKSVAIHRVRWNMNKGSERWLCYGGAAGIVRCQEIPSL